MTLKRPLKTEEIKPLISIACLAAVLGLIIFLAGTMQKSSIKPDTDAEYAGGEEFTGNPFEMTFYRPRGTIQLSLI